MNHQYRKGMKDGISICLGYFSVAFGFGILAVKSGLTALVAGLISGTNLTSAGQAAGVAVIAAGGSFLEMILTQIVINCRYSLMALSLSQNLSSKFNVFHRMAVAFGITDEIFGVAISRKEPITPSYMYGMITISWIGWVSGTICGAVCGEILPTRLSQALGILLYGMFIAVIIPPIRESVRNLFVILIAAGISCCIYCFAPMITTGFSIIISAVVSAGIMAVVAPVSREHEEAL